MQTEKWNLITFSVFYSRHYMHSKKRGLYVSKMLIILKQVSSLKFFFLLSLTKKNSGNSLFNQSNSDFFPHALFIYLVGSYLMSGIRMFFLKETYTDCVTRFHWALRITLLPKWLTLQRGREADGHRPSNSQNSEDKSCTSLLLKW